MSKRQLIEEIRNSNPTAQPQFLEQFDEESLHQYLKHLKAALTRQISIASWKRPQPRFRAVC
jgi:hypothetical protein